MTNVRTILVCSAAAAALIAAGGLAVTTPFSLEVLSGGAQEAVLAASATPSPVPEVAAAAQSSEWLAMFPSVKPAAKVVQVTPAASIMRVAVLEDAVVDLRLPAPTPSPQKLRFELALTDPTGGDDLFSTSSSAVLRFAKNSENVEIDNTDLPEASQIAAMAPVTGGDTADPEPAMLFASEPVQEAPAAAVAAASPADDFDPFGSFGLVSDPVSSLVDSYASERLALETANLAVEDAEYVAPFAKPEADPAAALTGSNGEIDISVLAGMSPEQIQASIALVAALRNPDQAQTYLDRLQGVRAAAPAPVRQLPPVQMSGIPGLNDELQLPSMQEDVATETSNLLTRGWEAIDTYGVVTLRRDGDASTDLVIEEGMVLGALGPVVSIRRTNDALIVETAKAGEIEGLPDFRPRPRPEWLYGLN